MKTEKKVKKLCAARWDGEGVREGEGGRISVYKYVCEIRTYISLYGTYMNKQTQTQKCTNTDTIRHINTCLRVKQTHTNTITQKDTNRPN